MLSSKFISRNLCVRGYRIHGMVKGNERKVNDALHFLAEQLKKESLEVAIQTTRLKFGVEVKAEIKPQEEDENCLPNYKHGSNLKDVIVWIAS